MVAGAVVGAAGTARVVQIAAEGQWRRCAGRNTRVDVDGPGLAGAGLVGAEPTMIVTLDWDAEPPRRVDASPGRPGGLAFDSVGRVYRSTGAGLTVSDEWGRDAVTLAAPVRPDLPAPAAPGVFTPARTPPGPWVPVSVAVDADDRLLTVDDDGSVAVVDSWSGELMRRVARRSARHPCRRVVDVAAGGRGDLGAWALLDAPPGLVRLDACGDGAPVRPLPPPAVGGDGRANLSAGRDAGPGPTDVGASVGSVPRPRRLAVSPAGMIAVLWSVPAGAPDVPGAWVTDVTGRVITSAAHCVDIDFDGDGRLVLARRPGEAFERLVRSGAGWTPTTAVVAPHYDGRAVARDPAGHIAYWSATGLRRARGAAVSHRPVGEIGSFRLDSGTFRRRWGRVFVEACVPPGTSLRARYLTSDDPDTDPGPRPADDFEGDWRPLYRRGDGLGQPWRAVASSPALSGAGGGFVTYEGVVTAPPGRYLWMALELRGTPRLAPRVRALRVEHPGHDLARRLPRSWSRDPEGEDFLWRYLAILEGPLRELGTHSATRHLLLDARLTPRELLPWLASFVGLALDPRWPVEARRALVAEAAALFRARGTARALERVLELYLGFEVVILEGWRLRGGAGPTLGAPPSAPGAAVLGAGLRVGGAAGPPGAAPNPYETAAHRFTVLIPAELDRERAAVVRNILDLHRPAHTVAEVCTLAGGMRLGSAGLRVELTSFVGAGRHFSRPVVGGMRLGGGGVTGGASPAATVGSPVWGGAS